MIACLPACLCTNGPFISLLGSPLLAKFLSQFLLLDYLLSSLSLRLPSPLQRQRPPLNHQRHNLKQHIRRRHRRQLGICIIRRRDLDQIRRHEIDPFQPTDDGPELPRRPTPRLGRPRRRRESRVQGIDIDGQIHGILCPDPVADGLDDALGADGVDFSGFDAREAAVAVVIVVRGAGEGGADAGVDVGVVG